VPAPSLSYRRFVANVAAGAGGRAAAILVAFALTTVLVRTLGTGVYGTWSFFFVLLGFHAQLDLGLSVALERAVARAAADERWTHVPTLLGSGLLLAAALSALLQIAVLAWPVRWQAALGDPQMVRACLLVLPACLFCSNAAAVAGAGLSGLQRTTTLALQRTVIGALAAVTVAALAMAGIRRLDVLLATYAAGLAAAALASAIAVARELPAAASARAWRPEGAAIGELLRIGGPLQATTLVAQLGDQALRLVLGSRFGPAAMGIYDLASRAAIAPRTLVASLLVALVPFAAGRERRDGRGAFGETLWLSTKYAALLIVPATAAGLVVARPLMAVWLGPEATLAADTARIFEVLLVALACQAIAGPMVALARADGRPGPEAVVTAIAQTVAVAVAATRPTLAGVVTAFALVITASVWVLWWHLRRRLDVAGPNGRWLAPLAGVAAGTGVIAWAAHMSAIAETAPWTTLLAAPALIAATAAALAFALGAIPPAERQVLSGLLARLAPRARG
jgi:O-antigen/teichoic acid export membrane protein